MKNLIFIFCLLFAVALSAQSLPDSIRVTVVDTTYIIEQITLDDGTPRLPARIEIVRAQGQGGFLNFLRGATYQAYANYYQAVLQYRAAERAAREIMRATNQLRPNGSDNYFQYIAGQLGAGIEGTYTLTTPQTPAGVSITIASNLRFTAGGTVYQVRILSQGALRITLQSTGATVADLFLLPGTRRYVSLDNTYMLRIDTLVSGQGR